MESQLRISGKHYQILKQHLYPEDDKEAVAVALCGIHKTEDKEILLVHQVTLIPYSECKTRETNLLECSTKLIEPLFQRLSEGAFSLLKIHSHPTGYEHYSSTDDQSDQELFESAFGWSDCNQPHASAILLPNGRIIARFFDSNLCKSNICDLLFCIFLI